MKHRSGDFRKSDLGGLRIMSTKTEKLINLPRIVSRAEWQQARLQLLAKEKAATRAHDALAAERRRLPMVR